MINRFEREPVLPPEQIENQGGIIAEKSTVAFLEYKHPLIEGAELTIKGGINDQHHIDAFLYFKGGLPLAIDITGAKGQKREDKSAQQEIMPFVYRYDEFTGKPISQEMPRFVFDVNLGFWDMLAHKMEAGTPIDKAMSPKEQKDSYRDFLGQVWMQIGKHSRGDSRYREKIRPYKKSIAEEAKSVFNKKELELLGMAA